MTRRFRRFSKGRELRTFVQDARGNVAMLFGLMIIPIVLLMGLAVDGLRALNAAETAQNALDASALAAAQALSGQGLDDGEITEVAQRYFNANVEGAGKVSYSSYGPVGVEANRTTGAVTVSVTTTVPTTFGQLAHLDNFTMTRSATAIAGISDIELGLMLDVTGSMREHGKLRALKHATVDLIDALIPEGRHGDKVRIGFAPYSEQVNLGRFAGRVSDDHNRSGCVAERHGSDMNTDAAPSRTSAFHVLTSREMRRYRREICPPAEVQPLTSDKDRLRDIVQRYRADGWTAGHLGIQWAWNLISPHWSGVWPGESTPEPYGKKDLIKAVVLMTDGEFNTAYTGGNSAGEMERESYRHAEDLCSNIKREGVIVFSVAFDLDDRDAERALEDCSSGDGYFVKAENEEELRRAYRDIAVKLSQLRISK